MNADWKVEKSQYAEFNVPTCGRIAVWQLSRERQPSWNSHDGLNLTCLDQCHGVCSHGTSSSQGWLKRIVIHKSVFNPWVYILVFARRWFMQVRPSHGSMPCGHQCFSAVAQATAKIRPRPAQVLFLMKELHRTTKAIAQMNADWKVEKSQYAEFNVPTCGNIPVCQLCRERKPLWNSHAWWPEFDMFGSIPWCSFPWHELLAGAKELLYSVNLIREFTSLFSPKVIYTGLPRNAFPRK